jgi:hypothetical protein
MSDSARSSASTPFLKAVAELFDQLADKLGDFAGQVTATIAGGTAVHWYTHERTTADVDAEFDHRRFVIPEELVVRYTDEHGEEQDVYLDRNYNPAFSLLHEDYADDATDAFGDLGGRNRIKVRLLSPLDLAVSKLARWAPVDRDDIEALARKNLLDPAALELRALQALENAIGCNHTMVTLNINDAVSRVRQILDRE